MTSAEDRLRKAIKAEDDERYYNGNIPSWASELANAASAYLASVKSPPAPTLRDVFPADEWEYEAEEEGGQPNGIGTIEPNDYREWFHTENETHHRIVHTLYGPWIEGPTALEADRRQKAAQHKARLAEEAAARKEAERPSEEDRILAEAEAILARRKAEAPKRLDDKPWIHIRPNGFTRYGFSELAPLGVEWEPRPEFEQMQQPYRDHEDNGHTMRPSTRGGGEVECVCGIRSGPAHNDGGFLPPHD